MHQLSCVQNKKDRGTVTEIYYRYSISVFSCFVIWSERTVPLKRPPASQELLAIKEAVDALAELIENLDE